jgi:hypothetical protein
MSIEKAKAALDAANDEVTEKALALLRAHIAARKLEAEFEKHGETAEGGRIALKWFEAEKNVSEAKRLLKKAIKKSHKALDAYDEAKRQ